TYKKAFGPKSSRVIRSARSLDSGRTDLIQLTDVLLGAVTFLTSNGTPASLAKVELVEHCRTAFEMSNNTTRGMRRLSHHAWVPPEQFFRRRRPADRGIEKAPFDGILANPVSGR